VAIKLFFEFPLALSNTETPRIEQGRRKRPAVFFLPFMKRKLANSTPSASRPPPKKRERGELPLLPLTEGEIPLDAEQKVFLSYQGKESRLPVFLSACKRVRYSIVEISE